MINDYANGRFPLDLFIHRGGNIYLTPGLNARWNEMVRLGVEKYGVRLYITGDIDGLGGWNGYRPWDAQGRYKAHYGKGAAAQGYSTHGGKVSGRQVFAVDVANVDALAPNNPGLARARLTALAKAVGLTVNFVTPPEWWHIGDFNDAWTVPVFGAVTINPGTTNRPSEEDDMYDDGKHREVLTASRPIKLYKMGTGVVAVGAGGGFWIVPNENYKALLIAWELAGPNEVARPIDQNELDTMRKILTTVNPDGDGKAGAAVETILKLSDDDVRRIVTAISADVAGGVADEIGQRLTKQS